MCPPVDEDGEEGSTRTVGCCSALKVNEVLTHGTMRMNPENTKLSEGSRTLKATCDSRYVPSRQMRKDSRRVAPGSGA